MSKDASDPGSLPYNPVRATDERCRWAQSFPTSEKSLGLKTVAGLHHSTWLKRACAVWVRSMLERRGTASKLPWSLLMGSGGLLILGRTGQKSWEKEECEEQKLVFVFLEYKFYDGFFQKGFFCILSASLLCKDRSFPVWIFSAGWSQCLCLPDDALGREELLLSWYRDLFVLTVCKILHFCLVLSQWRQHPWESRQ